MSTPRIVGCAISVAALVIGGPVALRAQSGDAESLIRELLAVWESGDPSGLEALFHDDAVYVDKPNAQEFKGLTEIEGYVGHVHSWAGEVEIQVVGVRGGDAFAVAEWVMTGVQDRPVSGMIPVVTDRPFTIHGITMVDVKDGRASRAVDYIQVVPLMLQLGARIELPGGVTLQGSAR